MIDWIKVEDQLPPHDQRPGSLGTEVLVFPVGAETGATAFFGRRCSHTATFYKYGAPLRYEPTHWMPLPPPPKET